jgi:hypothetical protein
MHQTLKRWLLAPIVVSMLAVLLTGCLVSDDDPAGDAAKDRLLATSRREYADVWESLHPSHQAIVSEEQFASCAQAAEASRAPEISELKVVDESVETKDIPEIGTVASHVIELSWKQGEDTRQTPFDMIEVDGEWKWVLDQSALDAFRAGECP